MGPGVASCLVGIALAGLGLAGPAVATVLVTDPDDPTPFLSLYRPTGQLDETGLSGFEFLVSSRTGRFRENDQYLISGEATEETTSLADDLGGVGELSGTPFHFSIQHNLAGGRNFSFSLTNQDSGQTTVQCWGLGCAAGSKA